MHIVQSTVLLLLSFLVAPFWNTQLKHKPFSWYHPIQCCKMKISKISDIENIKNIRYICRKYHEYRKYPIFSKISWYFPSLPVKTTATATAVPTSLLLWTDITWRNSLKTVRLSSCSVRNFWVYFLGNGIDLDKTWHMDIGSWKIKR